MTLGSCKYLGHIKAHRSIVRLPFHLWSCHHHHQLRASWTQISGVLASELITETKQQFGDVRVPLC